MPDTLAAPPAEATVGHNSAAVGEMIENDPAVLFREPDLVPALFEEIEKSISAHKPDLTTKAGREAIASLAFGIAKKKTKLDAVGKELNEDHRAAITKVDAVRKTIRDRLDELRDKARAPLDQWEANEKARETRINDMLRELNAAAHPPAGAGAALLDRALQTVGAFVIDKDTFRDRTEEVRGIRDRVVATLSAAYASAVKAEEAQAELARIKAEQAEKERVEAEAKAKADAKAEADRRAEAERQRQAAEVKAAEERAAAAAKAKADAEANAAREKERKAAQAKLDAAEAERKAAADALARKEAEEAEARAKAEAEAAERKRREADEEHRKQVIKTAVLAMSEQTGTPIEVCRQIVLAIAAGQVPAVSITF